MWYNTHIEMQARAKVLLAPARALTTRRSNLRMATSEYTPRTFILNNQEVLISTEDSDLIDRKWGLLGGKYARITYYQSATRKIKDIFLHRLILERMIGRELVNGEFVDHINGNTLDNRRDNLRLASKAQNCRNAKRRTDNPSGYKGVTLDRGKWRARISVDKKQIYLGSFDNPEDAYSAYCKAAKELHGEFARLS